MNNDRVDMLCDRIEMLCNMTNERLSDVLTTEEHGFTDDEMRILYDAVRDDSGEKKRYSCIVFCTAWLHAARILIKKGTELASAKDVSDILDMADEVMRELGRRSGHPADGSVVNALKGCLDLGRSMGVDNIEEISRYFRGYFHYWAE